MEVLDFIGNTETYKGNQFLTDLNKIKLAVSKEDDTVFEGREFVNTVKENVDNIDISNLNPENEDDIQFLDEIWMQWYIFV